MRSPQATHQTKGKTLRVPVKKHTEAPSPAGEHAKQPVSPCDDLHLLISKRAYELYAERGYRHVRALNDWLEAEREILSQIPPV